MQLFDCSTNNYCISIEIHFTQLPLPAPCLFCEKCGSKMFRTTIGPCLSPNLLPNKIRPPRFSRSEQNIPWPRYYRLQWVGLGHPELFAVSAPLWTMCCNLRRFQRLLSHSGWQRLGRRHFLVLSTIVQEGAVIESSPSPTDMVVVGC